MVDVRDRQPGYGFFGQTDERVNGKSAQAWAEMRPSSATRRPERGTGRVPGRDRNEGMGASRPTG